MHFSLNADERTKNGPSDSSAKKISEFKGEDNRLTILKEEEDLKCQNQDVSDCKTEKQKENGKGITDRALEEDRPEHCATDPRSTETGAKTTHLFILDVKVTIVQGNIAKQSVGQTKHV